MLKITIPEMELWDEKNEEFFQTKVQTIQLEHSLLSISKWESKWHKPFLKQEEKSIDEIIDYVRCMTVTSNVDPSVYLFLTTENMSEIEQYIKDPMTATWFKESKRKRGGRTVTSELVYYWMISLGIPMECQKWHFNRLMTLIQVCNEENAPRQKLTAAQRNSLNKSRRSKLNSKG